MADDYAAFADYYANLDTGNDEGMSLLDPVKQVGADVAGTAAAAATTGQVLAEKSGDRGSAKIYQGLSMLGHEAEDYADSSISEAGRRARDAALIPQEGQEQLLSHPGREALMKGSSIVVPALIGAIGEFAGGPIGTASAGAGYQIAHGIDRAVAWTNTLNDEELEKSAPVFGKFKRMYLEEHANAGMDPAEAEKLASEDARMALHDGLYGIKEAGIDAFGGAVTFGAGQKVIKGALGNKLTDYVLTGGAMGTGAAASDVNEQNTENVKKGTQDFHIGQTLTAFLNGTAEGLAFHGAGEAAHKLFGRTPKTETKTEEKVDEQAVVNVPPEGGAASTGVTPKTTRADTPPPPNEASQEGQIGNTVNPPVRDQGVGPAGAKVKGKKGKAKAEVPVVDVKAPAPDEAAALAEAAPLAEQRPPADLSSIQVPPERAPGPEPLQRLEVPDAPVTPEVSPATEVPEAGPTIEAQLADLNNKTRHVMRFNNDAQVPAERPKGVVQYKASDGSTWWYRTGKGRPSKEKIEAAVKGKTENELLGLGPYNKEAVAADVAAGAEPAAVVARTPEGTEVAAAATTDRLAPETAAAVQAANPEKIVSVEQPRGVIEGRENGTGKVANTLPQLNDAKVSSRLKAAAARVRNALSGRGKLKASEVEIPIDRLVSQQDWIEPSRKAPALATNEPPVVVHVDGKLVVRDGNHRIAAMAERGDKTIKARLVELDPYEQVGKVDEVKAEKTEPLKREPRVFDVTTPEQRAEAERAQAELDAKRAAEDKRLASIERGLEEKPEVVQGQRDSKDGPRVRAAQENAGKAQKIFDDHAPSEVEAGLSQVFGKGTAGEQVRAREAAKIAMIERLRRVADAATSTGYELPKAIRKHIAAEKFVRDAVRLIKGYDNGSITGFKPFLDFQKSEMLQRGSAEDFKVDLANTRADNDAKFQKKTGDRVETAEEVGSTNGVKLDARTEKRVVKDKSGKEVEVEAAQAASKGRVLSKEERAKLAAQYETPQSRPISLEDELLAGMDPVEGRETGERDGHISYGYGSDAPSAKILRTETAADLFRKAKAPSATLAGKLFPLIRMRLTHIVGDVKVHFVDAAEVQRLAYEANPQATGAQGFYKPKWGGEGGYIILADNIPADRMAHIFTHEALHAATEDALRAHEQFRGQITAIMSEVKAAHPDLKRYGFTNESEFIAEAFSNPTFQELLASTPVSDKLAKSLGLERRSLWSALVDAIRSVLHLPSHSALEALVKPTNDLMSMTGRMKDLERLDRQRPQMRAYLGEDMVDHIRGAGSSNARNLLRAAKRATQTVTMIAHSAAKIGERFGGHARQAAELSQRMDVERSKILERDGGGLEIAREADRLSRAHPEDFRVATDLGFAATELNVALGKGADNSHHLMTKDATRSWQAKKRIDGLQRQFDALERKNPEVAAWLEKAAKFGREEANEQSKELIRSVLEAADMYDPALAERIFNDGVTEADLDKFKTSAIVKHLNEIAGLKRMQGWYFPLMREGDYVVSARREFATPSGKHVTRISDDTVQFMDPMGKSAGTDSARARRAAREFVEGHEMRDVETRKVFVDVNDPTKIVDPSDLNARPAYRVKMQDKYMSMHKSEAEALAHAGELEKQGFKDITPPDLRRLNPNAQFGGFMPSQMQTMIRSLTQRGKFKDMTAGQQNELIQAMRQASVRLLPGTRLQHRNLQRMGVAGYSTDMVNSISKYAQSSAAFRARLKYQRGIDAALHGMHEDIEGPLRYSKDKLRAREIYQELETRLYRGHEFEQPSMLAKGLGALNKISMLDKLAGPSFHIINAQEPWTTSMPVIGGRHGFVNAVRMLKGAYNLIGARGALGAGFRDTVRAATQDSGFTDYRRSFQEEISKSVSGDRGRRLNDLLDHLHDLNLFGHEAGMEVHRLAAPADTAAGRLLDRADLMSRQVGQAIEAINRAVTGLAAYELEFKRNGGNHEAAKMYAHDVVHDAMGNYSASNAAPIFNNPIGRTALQFKKFAQKTYYLLGKMAVNAYHGDQEAMRQFAGVMFTHAVVAGALGLPLEPIKVALMVSGALGGYSYDDFEGFARDMAAEALGKTGGEALTRGLPRALLGVDTAGRQSLADLLTFNRPLSGKPNDIKAWLFDTIAGPAFGMPAKAGVGVGAAMEGDVEKAIDNLVPIKAVRDLARAGFGMAGGKLDRNGRQMMEPYSAGEAAVQAFGFTPGRKAEDYEERSRVNNESFKRKAQRGDLVNDWVTATPSGKAAAWRAVQEFNRTVPRDAQITIKQLQAQAKNRRKEQAEGSYDRGMRIGKQNRDIYTNAQRTYGVR